MKTSDENKKTATTGKGGFFSAANIQVVLLFVILLTQPFKKMHGLTNLFLILALVFIIVMIVKKRFFPLPRPFLYILVAYTASIILSTIISIDVEESIDGIRSEYLKQMIAFCLILAGAAETRKIRNTVLGAFFLSGLIMSTIGFFPYFFGFFTTNDHRLLSLSGSYTRLAYFYLFYIPFLILLLPGKETRGKVGIYILMALGLAATFFSKTRVAWITLPPSMLLVCILTKKWRTLLILALIFILCTGALFILSPTLRSRAGDFRELLDWSGSFGERLPLWKSAAKSIRQHPILGRGYGKYIFRKIYLENPVEGGQAKSDTHNTFIELLVQRGALGFLTTFLVYLFFLKLAWRRHVEGTPRGRAYFAYFVTISFGLALFSMVDNIYVKETGRYLWQLAALGFLPIQSPKGDHSHSPGRQDRS